jgi:hypothetical protein
MILRLARSDTGIVLIGLGLEMIRQLFQILDMSTYEKKGIKIQKSIVPCNVHTHIVLKVFLRNSLALNIKWLST